ncbi:MAG: bifunctional 4-hydroxy-2-oxoglutarate aldolase/2-dehydro-3-deoxy-phosphogluconate aldolase [Candidatus Omnitrophica bacterium]|nr:bifunctional 4-hydroxy-2-oxoglutarate aldolase/2-dehydro-3-deoxy-phosphogluconate aldolase [Candidatus Omnitrophota bacterium]MBU1894401.1 bifunctional 4-hydroxy-2-oxoglutarate aldolase/2-dehydro-3-deoxy-phosphogluconate aldolase [Candidatus Omnitrophota bacterium]
MGIVRGVLLESVEPLLEAVIASGLKTIEITMNTPHVGSIISKAKTISRGRIAVGAGTVVSEEDLQCALDNGAEFIVMPIFSEGVVNFCVKKNIPVFPGALTPQEVFRAWSAGACMVKVFPASRFGPGYIKDLKGPFDKIKLMAVGGVALDNIKDYFSAGSDAVAFGASVFKKEWLANKDFESIKNLTREYVNAVTMCL